MGNRAIAKNENFILYAINDENGYVKDISNGKIYETHTITSILSKGIWELLTDKKQAKPKSLKTRVNLSDTSK